MTSGINAALIDLEVDCGCGWSGDVLGVEDYDAYTLTWWCPGCMAEHPDNLRDPHEDGNAQALFLLRACAVFLMILGAIGASWFWFSIGLCVFAAPLIIRAAHAADARKGHRNV